MVSIPLEGKTCGINSNKSLPLGNPVDTGRSFELGWIPAATMERQQYGQRRAGGRGSRNLHQIEAAAAVVINGNFVIARQEPRRDIAGLSWSDPPATSARSDRKNPCHSEHDALQVATRFHGPLRNGSGQRPRFRGAACTKPSNRNHGPPGISYKRSSGAANMPMYNLRQVASGKRPMLMTRNVPLGQ